MTQTWEGTWLVRPGEDAARDRNLIGPQGERIEVCHTTWLSTPRLVFSARLPADLAAFASRIGHRVPVQEVTVSPNKTPEAVAAELTRRLFPAYRATVADIQELRDRRERKIVDRDALAAAIAAPLAATVEHPTPRAGTDHSDEAIVRYRGPLAGVVTVPLDAHHVQFTVSTGAERAAAVAAFLATFPAAADPASPGSPATPAPCTPPTPASLSSARFTGEQVQCALDNAADLLARELTLGDRDRDLLDLLLSATLTRLEDPEATLDQVIARCYITPPDEVRRWWTGWS